MGGGHMGELHGDDRGTPLLVLRRGGSRHRQRHTRCGLGVAGFVLGVDEAGRSFDCESCEDGS